MNAKIMDSTECDGEGAGKDDVVGVSAGEGAGENEGVVAGMSPHTSEVTGFVAGFVEGVGEGAINVGTDNILLGPGLRT
jgi:hypothetical protein